MFTILSWDIASIAGLVSIFHHVVSGRLLVAFSPLTFMRNPSGWIQSLSRYHIVSTAGPDFAYLLATKKTTDSQLPDWDLSHLRICVSGGETVRASTWSKFYEKFQKAGLRHTALGTGYGMAETVRHSTIITLSRIVEYHLFPIHAHTTNFQEHTLP